MAGGGGASKPALTKEENAVFQLKERIKDLTVSGKENANFRDDLYLVRWLKAENMHVGRTEQKIRSSVKWRLDLRAHSLASHDPPQELMWNYPFYCDGVDNTGLPVYCISPGAWDLRKIVESGGREKFVKYINQMYLRIEDHMIRMNQDRQRHLLQRRVSSMSNSSGAPPTAMEKIAPHKAITNTSGVVIVINLKGYNRSQISSLKTVETAVELATTYGNYFPEMAEKVFFINGSRVFTLLFKMIKPMLNLKNVEVYDSNEAHWKPAVLARIPSDQLRPEFGGSKREICSITITPCEEDSDGGGGATVVQS